MCSFCGQYECPSACPNAPEAIAVYPCSYSGCNDNKILPDDMYCEINGLYYHLDCLEDMGMEKSLKLVGIDKEIA